MWSCTNNFYGSDCSKFCKFDSSKTEAESLVSNLSIDSANISGCISNGECNFFGNCVCSNGKKISLRNTTLTYLNNELQLEGECSNKKFIYKSSCENNGGIWINQYLPDFSDRLSSNTTYTITKVHYKLTLLSPYDGATKKKIKY